MIFRDERMLFEFRPRFRDIQPVMRASALLTSEGAAGNEQRHLLNIPQFVQS